MNDKNKLKILMGNAIKTARIDAGLTQSELADKLGISRKTISSWEIDRTQPNAGQVQKMSEIFGCPVDGMQTIQTLLTLDEYKLLQELRKQKDNEIILQDFSE